MLFAGAVRLIYRIALSICVLAVAFLAFAPLEAPPLFSYDKNNHLLAFAVMAWLADRSWPEPGHAWQTWGWLLAYGLFIEVVQRELPFRSFSWFDFVADTIGIATYFLAKTLAVRYRSAR